MSEIAEQLLNALDEYTASCTVVITSAQPGVSHGSGVAVIYGGQQYILTAAHVLRNEPADANIKILGRPDGPMQMSRGKREFEEIISSGTYKPVFSSSISISIQGRISHDVDDIAALRVADLTKYLPQTLLHDLSNQGAVEIVTDEAVSIFGFPGELAKHYQRKSTGQGGWAAFPHITIQSVKDISAAPEQLDAAKDFVTDFDYAEDTCDPRGMSGCGAWRIPKTAKDEIWSAFRTQLLGIAIGHYKKSQLLRFVHIERLIRLLATGE
jgi:hypothetical protein